MAHTRIECRSVAWHLVRFGLGNRAHDSLVQAQFDGGALKHVVLVGFGGHESVHLHCLGLPDTVTARFRLRRQNEGWSDLREHRMPMHATDSLHMLETKMQRLVHGTVHTCRPAQI